MDKDFITIVKVEGKRIQTAHIFLGDKRVLSTTANTMELLDENIRYAISMNYGRKYKDKIHELEVIKNVKQLY